MRGRLSANNPKDDELGPSSETVTEEGSRPPQPGTTADLEALPTHSEDGVDLTVIRWMLSLTPAERLEVLQQTIRSIIEMRGETNH
jgi:hypothetical protein